MLNNIYLLVGVWRLYPIDKYSYSEITQVHSYYIHIQLIIIYYYYDNDDNNNKQQ
jgi:hypothetical protein